jgi:hypothetical protein
VIEGMGKLGYDIGPFAKQNIDKIDAGHADDKVEREGKRYVNWQDNVDEKTERPANTDMRADSVIENVVVSTEAPIRIFTSNSEFYGMFPETETKTSEKSAGLDNVRGLAKPPAHQRIREISRTGARLLKEQGAGAFAKRLVGKTIETLPQPIQRPVLLSFGAWEILRKQGPTILWFRLISKWNRVRTQLNAGTDLKEGQVLIKRDYGPLIEMIDKNYHGYVILKVRDRFYAIHHLYAFDKDQADRGDYPDGKCYTAATARELVTVIDSKSNTFRPPQMPNHANQAMM